MVIGLTGMSGAGKSTVAALLKEKGIFVIDADKIAKDIVKKGEPTLGELVCVFGKGILKKDGELNRRALAGIAFSNPKALQKLNDITHPAIIATIVQLVEESGHNAVIDAPLLYETGLDRLCHVVVMVTAPLSVRTGRICERDGVTIEEATARLASQKEQEQYIKRADYVIENGGTSDDLKQNVDMVWEKIVGRSERGKEKKEEKE